MGYQTSSFYINPQATRAGMPSPYRAIIPLALASQFRNANEAYEAVEACPPAVPEVRKNHSIQERDENALPGARCVLIGICDMVWICVGVSCCCLHLGLSFRHVCSKQSQIILFGDVQ